MVWKSPKSSPPKDFVSVLCYVPGDAPFPQVHEGYRAEDGVWMVGGYVRDPGEVHAWADMPEPPIQP